MPAAAPDAGTHVPEAGAVPSPKRPLLVDACCAINLAATRRMAEVLSDLPFRFAIAEVARREAPAVRRGGGGEGADDREPIAWDALVTAGLIEVLALGDEGEAAIFVELAAAVDDGEAATCAVAIQRGYAVATDDRGARRLLAARAPGVPLYSTAELLHRWCEVRGFSGVEIGQVLKDVRERGRFLPPRGDPLRPWWERFFPNRE